MLLEYAQNAARAAGVTRLVLQTGDRQPDAVRLYTTSGFQRVAVLGAYSSLPYSLCFAKHLGAG